MVEIREFVKMTVVLVVRIPTALFPTSLDTRSSGKTGHDGKTLILDVAVLWEGTTNTMYLGPHAIALHFV